MVKSTILAALVLILQPHCGGQTDSLIRALKTLMGHDRIPVLNELCYQFAFSDPRLAIQYSNESISLMQGADSALIASTYNDASLPYYSLGNYVKMIELNRRALEIRTDIGDVIGQAASYSKIGLAFEELGMMDSALNNDEKALDIYTLAGLESNRIMVLNNIANIQERLGNLDQALKLHLEIQGSSSMIGDSFSYYKSVGNEANVLTKLKRFGQAELKLNEAERYFLKENMAEQLGSTYLAQGVNFKGMGDTLKAIECYRRAYETNSSLGIQAPQPLVNMGNCYLETGILDSAEFYLLKGLEIAQSTRSFTQLRHVYGTLSHLEERRNNYSKSLAYLKLRNAYQDSVFTESISDHIAEYQIAYQTEKAEKIKLEEMQKRTAAELELSIRNRWVIGISGALLAVLLISLLMIQYRARLAQTEKNKAVLSERERGLEAVFTATEEERQRIARDLHDGIGQQMSGIKLAMSGISASIKSSMGEQSVRIDELNKILDATANEIRELSHRMMPRVLEEFGLIPALEEMLSNSLKLTAIRFEFERLNFDGRLDHKIELSLYRVAQELVNNVIKHSGANVVIVQLFKSKGHLILIVEDNGKGLGVAASRDGIGLMNIRSRLNTIHGDVNFQASPQAGTTVTVRIKL